MKRILIENTKKNEIGNRLIMINLLIFQILFLKVVFNFFIKMSLIYNILLLKR